MREQTIKLVTYRWGGVRHAGRLSEDGAEVLPLDAGPQAAVVGALAVVEAMSAGQPVPPVTGGRLPLAAVTLEAPLPRPRRNLFCVGKNYREHAREFARSGFDSSRAPGQDIPEYPIVFSKVPESVIAHRDSIRLPRGVSDAVDYEAELAVVIGRGGRGISRARAMDHVWGYTIVNDVTARDWQSRHKQWLMGKSFDTFCPMGPCLAHAGSLDGTSTRLRCWVNGELRQEASTRDLIFDIPALVETVSAGITLLPGDVICTGTPAGVGIGFEPPRYLRSGDTVRIEIDGIGVLENPVV